MPIHNRKGKKITFLPESSKIGIEPMKGGDLESHTPCAGWTDEGIAFWDWKQGQREHHLPFPSPEEIGKWYWEEKNDL